MLQVHRSAGPGTPLTAAPDAVLDPAAIWLDLDNPTQEETAFVLRMTGLVVPSLTQLSEVEISSRLRREHEAVYLSVPIVFRDEHRRARITPVGFLLTEKHLVTVRFEDLKAFKSCRETIEKHDLHHPSAPGILVTLLEAIVDRLADVLEETGEDIDQLSEEVFGRDADPSRTRRPKVQGQRLRVTLRQVGRYRQLISKIRATLLAIGRLAPFLEEEASWLSEPTRARLHTVERDVVSLDEYEAHLSDKVQFLLDADLGLINIEQNDTFRVLTVVSVVGIPPTLVASLYGMNFVNMPELKWEYGYVWGLSLVVLSAVLPLVWFRLKGWF
ncbi:magnesium transporter CorA family protein [Enterovirga rhinocerotis]|uniref:Magnesium transport protein CorA n=1 Tax=Enterovirga rhinocerotis TaxID=1339210 RepID=A0A4R7C510_9HYPH|nr:magnesium transporter CorA family protein [Enterovirga rhinocerotis]TDR93251.1 magnesium transporter [Enterovirga rhinocerotis]